MHKAIESTCWTVHPRLIEGWDGVSVGICNAWSFDIIVGSNIAVKEFGSRIV